MIMMEKDDGTGYAADAIYSTKKTNKGTHFL